MVDDASYQKITAHTLHPPSSSTNSDLQGLKSGLLESGGRVLLQLSVEGNFELMPGVK